MEMNIRLTWFAVIQNIWWVSRLICIGDEESNRSKPTCVIEFDGFMEDNLTVTWTLPGDIIQDTTHLVPLVNWYLTTEPNYGHCSVVNLTSCVCYYSDDGCMDSGSLFSLNVTILNGSNDMEPLFAFTSQFDSENCFKPPPITSVNFTTINSFCLEIKWDCSFLVAMYKISYKHKMDNSTWEATECDHICRNCSDGYKICGLHPFTEYDVVVQSRLYGSNDAPTGHWSIPEIASATTDEYVPSGVPLTIPNGFALMKNNCKQNNTREIRFYWKGIDKLNQNGVITQYQISTWDINNNRSIVSTIKSPAWFYNIALRCDGDYDLSVRAGTRIGFSQNSSSVRLKSIKGINEAPVDYNIIPEINRSFSIINITVKCRRCRQVQHVVWCLLGKKESCEGPIDWKMVNLPDKSLVIESKEVSGPLQDLKVGVTSSTNGIIWANCLYIETNELHPPTNLQAFPSLSQNSGAEVTWENQQCSSGNILPYIDSFEIHVCEVSHKQSAACSGKQLVFSVDSQSSSFVIPGLKEGAIYKVFIISVGYRNIRSDTSRDIYVQPKYKGSFWKSTAFIILAVSFSAIVISALAYFVRYVYRRMRRHYEKICKVEWIKLVTVENGL